MEKDEIYQMPSKLNLSDHTYLFLSELQYNVLNSDRDHIVLDFRETEYVDAIYMAFLGGMKILLSENGKSLMYRVDRNTKLYKYFRRSGLYEYFVKSDKTYVNGNAIPFSNIHMDEEYIMHYIDKILELAPITLLSSAEENLFKNIYEIFSNSSEHSLAKCGVYACGHWMPKKNILVFSVYDTGIGIPKLIKEKVDPNLSSEQALRWALETGNSTKQLNDGTPRGLGLSDLLKFIELNEGQLHILSNDICYSYKRGNENILQLKRAVVGTMISFVIIADTEHVYI